jgi:endonuclease/exonuclease/phosphatase family metal-dependent hydrolase
MGFVSPQAAGVCHFDNPIGFSAVRRFRMFSWRPSNLFRNPTAAAALILTTAALVEVTPAFAQRNSRHRPGRQASSTQPKSPQQGSSANTGLGKATPDNALVAESTRGCASGSLVTVATYNVENFWDDVEENSGSNNYDEYKKGGSNWYAEQMYTQKAINFADAIRMAGAPDIVAMQEIESANNTSRTLEIMKPYVESMGYKYFALGLQNPKNPVAVTSAVMSKYPIKSNSNLDFHMSEGQSAPNGSHEDTTTEASSSARDPQVVTIDVGGKTLRLYTAHFKSRRGDFATGENMRVAAAELIKKDIEKQVQSNPALDVLVMGDFNANETERPLTEALKAIDDKNVFKRDLSDDRMYNFWFELPAAERCSYMHGGALQCLDHMLSTASLFDGKGLDLVEGSFQVVGHNGGEAASKMVKSDGRTPYRWGMQKSDRGSRFTGTGYSDHLPLVATFKIADRCKAAR